MNITAQCPHCQNAINGPAGVEVSCPHCQCGVVFSPPPAVMPKLGCMGTLAVVLVFSVGWALAPTWWNKDKSISSAPPINTEAESHWHSAARRYVEAHVRDTLSLQYHDWKDYTNDTRQITTADIVSPDGFGKPVRQRWVFSFDRQTTDLMHVMVAGKTVFDKAP